MPRTKHLCKQKHFDKNFQLADNDQLSYKHNNQGGRQNWLFKFILKNSTLIISPLASLLIIWICFSRTENVQFDERKKVKCKYVKKDKGAARACT